MDNQHDAREAQDTRRAFLGAQNDAWFIILGEPPAQNNDYPRHDADRTAIAKVYDEALCRQLVDAWNRRATPPAEPAQPERVGLTLREIEAGYVDAYRTLRYHSNSDYFEAGVQFAERHHGIGTSAKKEQV